MIPFYIPEGGRGDIGFSTRKKSILCFTMTAKGSHVKANLQFLPSKAKQNREEGVRPLNSIYLPKGKHFLLKVWGLNN